MLHTNSLSGSHSFVHTDSSVLSFSSNNSGRSYQDGQGVLIADRGVFDDGGDERETFLPQYRGSSRGKHHRGSSAKIHSGSSKRSTTRIHIPGTSKEPKYGEGAPPLSKRRRQHQHKDPKERSKVLQPLALDADNMPPRSSSSKKNTRPSLPTQNGREAMVLQETQKENDQLRKQLEALQKTQSNKRKRYQVFTVEFDTGIKNQIGDAVRQYVWPHWQFLASEEEEVQAMTLALKKVPSEWKKLENLEEEDRNAQVKEYLKIYGADCLTGKLNSIRNQVQQNIRGEWLKLYKNDKKVSANQFLVVAQRPAELILLPEEDEEGNQLRDNQKENQKNKKRLMRFILWVDTMMGTACGKKAFGPLKRSNHCISSYQYKDGEEVIPAGMEALVIVLMENAQKKWAFEGDLEISWNRPMNKKDRLDDKYKKNCPKTPFTTVKGGNNKYGGWNAEGRKRFAKVRALIQKGRNKETTEELEEQTREFIETEQEGKREGDKEGEKKKKEDLSQAQVGCMAEVLDDLEEEDYDSEEEEKALDVDKTALFAKPVYRV